MSASEEQPGGPLAASIEKLREELDRLMDVAVSRGERALDVFGVRTRHWIPAVDVIETGEDVLVDVEMPGVDPQSVDITLAGNMLTLKGTKPVRTPEQGETAHVHERLRGDFQRSIPLPVPVDPEQVSADAQRGVLHIRLTKTERAKAKQIKVSVSREPHEHFNP